MRYVINEKYLIDLGFVKISPVIETGNSIYRYYNPATTRNGLELTFIEEFGVLSVEEFWMNQVNGNISFGSTVVGKFAIQSDDDLFFIFSRNVRLNFIFNVAFRRI